MSYDALLETMGQVNDVLNAKSLLSWDARTMMPPGGAVTRAKQLATLAVIARDLLVADGTRSQLDAAEAQVVALDSDSVERTIVAHRDEDGGVQQAPRVGFVLLSGTDDNVRLGIEHGHGIAWRQSATAEDVDDCNSTHVVVGPPGRGLRVGGACCATSVASSAVKSKHSSKPRI